VSDEEGLMMVSSSLWINIISKNNFANRKNEKITFIDSRIQPLTDSSTVAGHFLHHILLSILKHSRQPAELSEIESRNQSKKRASSSAYFCNNFVSDFFNCQRQDSDLGAFEA
jgi:hypothetical protein